MIELAAASLRTSGSLRMRVAGSSMLPAIRPGDIVTVRRASPAEASRGDVVLFVRDGRFFTHRVIERRGSSMVTRGDAVAVEDPPVHPNEFLGIVISTQRGHRPASVPRQTSLGRAAATIFRRSSWAGRVFTRLNGLANRAAQ